MIVEEDEVEGWRKAGAISAQALEYGKSLIKKGVTLVKVCDAVDEKIIELGAKPSFPAQISLDHVAAHYCPPLDDPTILDAQVCKLDVGASVDGFLGDNAVTVDLSGRNERLVEASEKALEDAIKVVKAGVEIGRVGAAIHDAITGMGFSPIRNLSGHGLGINQIHTPPTIPNFANGDSHKLSENEVIAIEPFATTGKGVIYESSSPEVFMQVAEKPVRDARARQVLEKIRSYGMVPFAKRWLLKDFPAIRVAIALRSLEQNGIIQSFAPLIEDARGLVSQAEKTILVTKDGCEVLT